MALVCGVNLGIPCPQALPGFWTPWLDRDDVSGDGDFESISSYYPSPETPCEDGSEALNINCRTADTKTPWYDLAISDFMSCTIEDGLSCRNSDLPTSSGLCPDFEVRFYCGYSICETLTDCGSCKDHWPTCAWKIGTGCLSVVDDYDQLPEIPFTVSGKQYMLTDSLTPNTCDPKDFCSVSNQICDTDLGPEWEITPWESLETILPNQREILMHSIHLDLHGTPNDMWKHKEIHVSWAGSCCYDNMLNSRPWFVRTDEYNEIPDFFGFMIDSMDDSQGNDMAVLGRYPGNYRILCRRNAFVGSDDEFCMNNQVVAGNCECDDILPSPSPPPSLPPSPPPSLPPSPPPSLPPSPPPSLPPSPPPSLPPPTQESSEICKNLWCNVRFITIISSFFGFAAFLLLLLLCGRWRDNKNREGHVKTTCLSPVSDIELGCIMNNLNSVSSHRDSVESTYNAYETYQVENPLLSMPSVNSEIVAEYMQDNNKYMSNINSAFDEYDFGADVLNIQNELSVDMELITNACKLEGATSDPIVNVERVNENLSKLEGIVEERRGKKLWNMIRDDKWSSLLDTIKRVKGNLKPIEIASRERNFTIDKGEWLKSIRDNLRSVK